jgi:hypothetical protein
MSASPSRKEEKGAYPRNSPKSLTSQDWAPPPPGPRQGFDAGRQGRQRPKEVDVRLAASPSSPAAWNHQHSSPFRYDAHSSPSTSGDNDRHPPHLPPARRSRPPWCRRVPTVLLHTAAAAWRAALGTAPRPPPRTAPATARTPPPTLPRTPPRPPRRPSAASAPARGGLAIRLLPHPPRVSVPLSVRGRHGPHGRA